MMETANSTAMRVTDTKTLCSSPNSPKGNNAEITREREEELLYGSNEDCDDEDALSDDSFRLRVSDEGEEQHAANKDAPEEIEKQKKTEMESGSDVTSADIAERKSMLKCENLTNGKCSIEKDSSEPVGGPNEEIHERGTSSGAVSTRPDSFDRKRKEHRNGDTDRGANASIKFSHDNVSSNPKWHYFGRFGHYSRSGKRHQFSRQSYPVNSCNDKYYNQNTHYGRGRSFAKGYGLQRTREFRGRLDGSPINAGSSLEISVKSENTYGVSSPTANATSESGGGPSSSTDSRDSPTTTNRDVLANSVPVSAETSTRSDIAAVARECEDRSKPGLEVNQDENVSPKCEESIFDRGSNVMDVVDCKATIQAVDETRADSFVAEYIDHVDTHAREEDSSIRLDNVEMRFKSESDAHEAESNRSEALEKCNTIVDDSQSRNSYDDAKAERISENTEKPENDKNLLSGISLEGTKAQNHESVELKASTELEDAIMTKNDDRVASKGSNDVECDKSSAANKTDVVVRGEETTSDKINEDSTDSAVNQQCSIIENHEEKLPDTVEAKVTRGNDRESDGDKSGNERLEKGSIAEKDEGDPVGSPIGRSPKLPNEDTDSDNAESRMDLVDDDATTFCGSLKRASSEFSLDDMELSKRLQIERDKSVVVRKTDGQAITKRKYTTIYKNAKSNGESRDSASEENTACDNVVDKLARRDVEEKVLAASTKSHKIDGDEKVDDCEVVEVPIKRKQKRSRRSLNILRESIVSHEDSQETENVRQKRKTAQNAEEIIRKECLANTDSESNDSLSKFVTVNHRANNNLGPTSPPTLKRNYVDEDGARSEGTTMKKLKADVTLNGDTLTSKNESVESETKRTLQHVRNFFRRDPNGSLCKLRQEELEELLIQKVVETLTMRNEIGKLREQAKVSERNQEAMRLRCLQLAKQIKDFEMVLNRYKSDLRTHPDPKTVMPIKINRSVGLQVNFLTDHGIQNLRQLQQTQKIGGTTVNGTIGLQQPQQLHQQKQQQQQIPQLQLQIESSTSIATMKRTVKVRSPRQAEHPSSAPVVTAVTTPVNSPHVSTITPAALVVSKPASDSRPSVTPANQQTAVMHPQLISSNQAILVNGNVATQSMRQAPTTQASKAKNNDLIDLTQEEDKTKTAVTHNTILAAALSDTTSNVSNIQKLPQRFHTVIQTIPSNMAISAQSGIRVVQPSSQPTPTALVNNMNAPRLTYVTMQSGMVPRQVVLTSTPTPIRPAPANNIRTTFPISGTITNSTVRVIPTTSTPALLYKHPAALPETSNTVSSPSWRLPPPAPSLKISKVANGIVLSWNMALTDKFADIASYQLYAYQEISGVPPSSTLWKKVGDVRALPLPMACTLTQFSEGNNYYFAVRAVDKHSRLGQYSQPGNISL